jgi:hypothetical protein
MIAWGSEYSLKALPPARSMASVRASTSPSYAVNRILDSAKADFESFFSLQR